MTKIQLTPTVLVAFATLGLAIGCNNAPSSTQSPAEPVASTNGTPHAHDESDALHGHDEHDHALGPHDGTMVDWGGGAYHLEFTVDHEKQETTVYIYGPDEKTVTPIATKEILLAITNPAIDLTLTPLPQDGDPEGKSSRFIGKHEGFAVEQEYEGTLSGVIVDTPYTGDFEEGEHDHEEEK